MNTFAAVMMGKAAAERDAQQMIFDWHKAARLIKERGVQSASAGLRSDWEYTGDSIFVDGKPNLGAHPFLSSNWAVPELDLDGDEYGEGGQIVECYIYADNNPEGWDSGTVWPASALAILHDGTQDTNT